MDITVALDGSTERNLRFYEGDEEIIMLTVYEHDGDIDPISVTNPAITTGPKEVSFPVATQFVVQATGRLNYRMVAEVDGYISHICSGVITVERR
jgi:hypothetical protein